MGDADLTVFPGGPAQVRSVSSVEVHPGYVPGQAYYDVAVVTLDNPVNLSSSVRWLFSVSKIILCQCVMESSPPPGPSVCHKIP